MHGNEVPYTALNLSSDKQTRFAVYGPADASQGRDACRGVDTRFTVITLIILMESAGPQCI